MIVKPLSPGKSAYRTDTGPVLHISGYRVSQDFALTTHAIWDKKKAMNGGLLDSAKYLYLRELTEPRDNSLRVVVQEAVAFS
jgi:hypothetical protein